MKKLVSLVLMVWGASAWAAPAEHPDRNESQYNNEFAVVLNGYDPVSYFPEGGGAPQLGRENISFIYGTRVYHFVNEANREVFAGNPLKYEPTYGAWCAWGMANNGKIRINPTIYTLVNNRLHFFINRSAKRNFDADISMFEASADTNWNVYSGELPRK